ncbi:glycosyltransferase family 2 protein [Clostridium estertheticum]|uniref:Glycosyltransferase family 2 protein n=1 Tax=Clostridium estertheticum TaxID=238834 RepID=A0AA47EHQ8_9CLOT|nr:glycosyltransferase family 2 protein [Clostridium estertheticum]MBU3155347.1 glycosyltransferase family 2 protein [Clostridium estertheticum]WAG60407.1 glycosyltransferase family 2 protein [Clostridium estertheticum]
MNQAVIEVSVVIPVWNEAQHLQQTLKTIAGFIRQSTKSFELIIVDDGSTDGTWAELMAVCSEIPQVEGIRLSRNFGKERALCAGLEHAKGQAVIIMDGDLQHPPELIPQMIDYWRSNTAKIIECVKRRRGKESFSYGMGAKLFYWLIQKLTRYDLQGASDYKLLDRQVVEAWAIMPERITFFRGMTAWLGFFRVQIEFDVAPRIEGTTSWKLTTLVRLALHAVVTFTSWPLSFVSIIGMMFFVGSAILGIQTLYMKLMGVAVTGFTTVILLLLSMNSMIMLGIGILGEYIAAIYDEVKGRPRYTVSQKTQNVRSDENVSDQ